MKIQINVEIDPFSVPSYVVAKGAPGKREDGFKTAPAIPLADLSPETLDQLCNDFRREVFNKAMRQDPQTKAG